MLHLSKKLANLVSRAQKNLKKEKNAQISAAVPTIASGFKEQKGLAGVNIPQKTAPESNLVLTNKPQDRTVGNVPDNTSKSVAKQPGVKIAYKRNTGVADSDGLPYTNTEDVALLAKLGYSVDKDLYLFLPRGEEREDLYSYVEKVAGVSKDVARCIDQGTAFSSEHLKDMDYEVPEGYEIKGDLVAPVEKKAALVKQAIYDNIVIENPKGSKKEFGKNYPIPVMTYPVDYGYLPGYMAQDDADLDFFKGSDTSKGFHGSFDVWRPDVKGELETKFYTSANEEEKKAILEAFKKVIRGTPKEYNNAALLDAINSFKIKTAAADPAQTILITGHSGSGKSTLGKLLSEKLNLPLHRVDAHPEFKEYVTKDNEHWKESLTPGTKEYEHYTDLVNRANRDTLKTSDPASIVEGAQLGHLSPEELAKYKAHILVGGDVEQSIAQRIQRAIDKAAKKGVVYSPEEIALRKDKSKLVADYWQPGMDKFNKLPGVLKYNHTEHKPEALIDQLRVLMNKKANALVVSGIHGDEPAGDKAAQKLKDSADVVSDVNPSDKRRFEGKDINRHFDKPTEGKVQKTILDIIRKKKPSKVIALHEDDEVDKPYAYSSESLKDETREALKEYSTASSAHGDKTEDGVISEGKNPPDGSLEKALDDRDIPRVTLETPSKSQNMNKRVETQLDIVKKLLGKKAALGAGNIIKHISKKEQMSLIRVYRKLLEKQNPGDKTAIRAAMGAVKDSKLPKVVNINEAPHILHYRGVAETSPDKALAKLQKAKDYVPGQTLEASDYSKHIKDFGQKESQNKKSLLMSTSTNPNVAKAHATMSGIRDSGYLGTYATPMKELPKMQKTKQSGAMVSAGKHKTEQEITLADGNNLLRALPIKKGPILKPGPGYRLRDEAGAVIYPKKSKFNLVNKLINLFTKKADLANTQPAMSGNSALQATHRPVNMQTSTATLKQVTPVDHEAYDNAFRAGAKNFLTAQTADTIPFGAAKILKPIKGEVAKGIAAKINKGENTMQAMTTLGAGELAAQNADNPKDKNKERLQSYGLGLAANAIGLYPPAAGAIYAGQTVNNLYDAANVYNKYLQENPPRQFAPIMTGQAPMRPEYNVGIPLREPASNNIDFRLTQPNLRDQYPSSEVRLAKRGQIELDKIAAFIGSRPGLVTNFPARTIPSPSVGDRIGSLLLGKNYIPSPIDGESMYDAMLRSGRNADMLEVSKNTFGNNPLFHRLGLNKGKLAPLLGVADYMTQGKLSSILSPINGGNTYQANKNIQEMLSNPSIMSQFKQASSNQPLLPGMKQWSNKQPFNYAEDAYKRGRIPKHVRDDIVSGRAAEEFRPKFKEMLESIERSRRKS